jgi:hypothetical protein
MTIMKFKKYTDHGLRVKPFFPWLAIVMTKAIEGSSFNDFERERFPCTNEWWCIEGFFTTEDGQRHWSFKADFLQAVLKQHSQASSYSLTIFDLDHQKKYYYYTDDDDAKLVIQHTPFSVQFKGSSITKTSTGYVLDCMDVTHKIRLHLNVQTVSTPYWVAQSTTNGWLPWGLGYYRYGFIPKNTIKGTLQDQNTAYAIQGNSYVEHAWGDFSYLPIPSPRTSLIKIFALYVKLFYWRIHNHRFTIPTSLALSTDNRPPGYDWFWATLQNGWSLFFGNLVFWITEGPATGTLILSKDGVHYDEFGDMHFKYNQMKYMEEYDFYYPTDLELTARKGQETLSLHISSATESTENVFKFEHGGRHIGVILSQVPGKINGYYFVDREKILLAGDVKMESHRLLNTFGHTVIKFDIDRSKGQRALRFYLQSHYLRKEMHIAIQFPQRPILKIKYKRIDRPPIHSRRKEQT